MLEVGRELRMCQIRSFDLIFFSLFLSPFFSFGFYVTFNFGVWDGVWEGVGWDVEGGSIKI